MKTMCLAAVLLGLLVFPRVASCGQRWAGYGRCPCTGPYEEQYFFSVCAADKAEAQHMGKKKVWDEFCPKDPTEFAEYCHGTVDDVALSCLRRERDCR